VSGGDVERPESGRDALPLYRLTLGYVGGPFEGWQSQPGGTGVQDHLEKALRTMLRHDVRVAGASRTDSGVHAERQVASFRTAVPFDERKWLKSLQGLLPPEIGILEVGVAPADFHPAFSAAGKAYRYRLWLGVARNPFVLPYVWSLYQGLDAEVLAVEAQAFVGTHDYTSFCAADSGAKTRTRTVTEVAVHQSGPLVDVWVTGQGFLKQMVRTMVGTLVDIAQGRRPRGQVAEILACRDRTRAGQTAPALGLALVEVFYEEGIRTVQEIRGREGFKLSL